MSLDQALMIPGLDDAEGAPVAASPSIIVTTQGAAATQAVSIVTSVNGDGPTVDNFGNVVETDGGGMILSNSAASGWSTPGGSNPATFTKDAAGVTAAPSLGSGTGSVGGSAGADAVAEVTELDFDDATAGSIVISGSDPIDAGASAGEIETALEAATSRALSVAGTGPFVVTDDVPGEHTDLSLDSHTLTK